jgi:SAM-dependent methyltransferase
MTSYIFDNAAEAETAQRFNCLDTLYNSRTFHYLEATGIRSGWHCLEIGGGSGSVAAWMSERVGSYGSVLVTDIDPRFIEASGFQRVANVEMRRHDVGTDPLPEAAFDLIHARLVLLQVRQRRQALERIVRALKPGGWLVVEEFEGRLIDRTFPTADAAEAARFNKMALSLDRLMDERGFEAEWPPRLYGRLKAAGLTDVGMEGHLAVREGGSLGAILIAANFTQVRNEAVAKGLVTGAEVDAVLARLTEPDFAFFSPVMFTAWGCRPRSTADRASASVKQGGSGKAPGISEYRCEPSARASSGSAVATARC